MDILAWIEKEVKAIFQDICCDATVSVAAMETGVLEATRALGRQILAACLSESARQEVPGSVDCPVCGGVSRRLRKRGRYVETLCGVVRVFR